MILDAVFLDLTQNSRGMLASSSSRLRPSPIHSEVRIGLELAVELVVCTFQVKDTPSVLVPHRISMVVLSAAVSGLHG